MSRFYLFSQFCMWFQAKLLSFYSNLCRTYEISQNPPWVETQKIPFLDFSLGWERISTLLVEPIPTLCPTLSGTKYSKRSDFVATERSTTSLTHVEKQKLESVEKYQLFWDGRTLVNLWRVMSSFHHGANAGGGSKSRLVRSRSRVDVIEAIRCLGSSHKLSPILTAMRCRVTYGLPRSSTRARAGHVPGMDKKVT